MFTGDGHQGDYGKITGLSKIIVLTTIVSLPCFLLLCCCAGTALAAEDGSVVVYATIPEFGTVNVIDVVDNSMIAMISGLNDPYYLAIIPNMSKVYVTEYSSNYTVAINMSTHEIIARIPVYGHPCGIAASPDGRTVYVAGDTDNFVSIINTTTDKMVGMVETGRGPTGVCVNPATGYVYVTNVIDRTISVIDGLRAIGTIYVQGNLSARMAVSPDGSRLYAAGDAYNLTIIDTATNHVLSYKNMTGDSANPLTPYPSDVAVSPDGNYVYVACNGSEIKVVEAGTGNIVRKTNANATKLTLRPDGKVLYATDTSMGRILTINTATGIVEKYFDFTPLVNDIVVLATGPYSVPESARPGPLPDYTPPVTTLNLSGQTDEHGAFIGKVTCNLTATDNVNGSGIKTIEYYMAGGQGWMPYKGTFNITTPGTVVLYYHAIDKAGNGEIARFKEITIVAPQDVVTPVPSPSPSPSPVPSNASLNVTATPEATPTPKQAPVFETIAVIVGILILAIIAILSRRK